MPRRVLSILGSLGMIAADRYPMSVLDIGSGTGATALALDLMNAPRHITLLGLEPSLEMIRFAESSRFRGRVTARYNEALVGDGSLGNVSFEDFDLVVLSATFPYRFSEWDSLMQALGSHVDRVGTMVIAVEPEAKADILDSSRGV